MKKGLTKKSIHTATNYKINNLLSIYGGSSIGNGGVINSAIGDSSRASTNIGSIKDSQI